MLEFSPLTRSATHLSGYLSSPQVGHPESQYPQCHTHWSAALRNVFLCHIWRYTPVSLEFRRLRQEDHKFEASLGYIVSFRLDWPTQTDLFSKHWIGKSKEILVLSPVQSFVKFLRPSKPLHRHNDPNQTKLKQISKKKQTKKGWIFV